MKRKPTRRDLMIVIGRLQNIIGSVTAAAGDRNPDRAADIARLTGEGLALCIEALAQDPPLDRPTGPWAKT